MHVYKLFRAAEWQAFISAGVTDGAPIDLTDGYIHMSTAEQAQETADKHFAGETDLMLLALETEGLGEALRWETSRGGAMFPHLFRALRLADVVWARPIPDGAPLAEVIG